MLDAAFDAGCSPVVVVTGSDGEKIDQELQQSRVVKIQNNNWQRGIGSSIRSGVKVLLDPAAKVEAVVLLVCDQPFVSRRDAKFCSNACRQFAYRQRGH